MTGSVSGGAAVRENFVVTIDGLSGSGKSTVARLVAESLGALHLNSGLLYRAVGSEAEKRGVALDDEEGIRALALEMVFEFVIDGSGRSVLLVDGQPAGSDLGSNHAGELASRVATHPSLRDILNSVQRASRKKYSLVLEGRDAGTVVFPKAKYKFFLTASLEERARRRFLQLVVSRPHLDLEQVRAELSQRDERDIGRECAPGVMAEDAREVQTEGKVISDIVTEIIQYISCSSLD